MEDSPYFKNFKINSLCSIFSAEVFAIKKALEYIRSRRLSHSIICTDSKSTLEFFKKRGSGPTCIHGLWISLRVLGIWSRMDVLLDLYEFQVIQGFWEMRERIRWLRNLLIIISQITIL